MRAVAQDALRIALDASQLLAAAYAEQAMAVRRRATGRLPALLGGTLSSPHMDEATARSFLAAFNMAMVPIYWRDVEAAEGSFDWSACDRQIEWCREQGLRICLGPLFQPDARGLPDWVYLWDDDFESLLSGGRPVHRCRGESLSRKGRPLALCGPREHRASPALLRGREAADGGLDRLPGQATRSRPPADDRRRSALGRVPGAARGRSLAHPFCRRPGPCPPGSQGNSPGDELRLFCRRHAACGAKSRSTGCWTTGACWACRCWLAMTVPSADGDDPRPGRSSTCRPARGISPRSRPGWRATCRLILAKPGVQAVLWNQFEDGLPHEFPHAGLLHSQGQAKPALRTLAALRAACVNPRPAP